MIAEKEFLSPGMPGAEGKDPAPAPLQIPQGGGPYLVGRSHRRRRSAGLLPPPPVPAEMPVDTAGRVVFISQSPPPDVRPEPPGDHDETPVPAAAAAPLAARIEGWTAVALAAGLVLAVFLVGMVLFR